MKKLLFALGLLSGSLSSGAQTTATDFTANDCSGTSHNLFSELESGRIIVIAWVMPCGGCIVPARTAYNISQSYAIDYPDRVYFYVVDDYANTSCSSIESWANSNNMPNSTKFSNSTISMSDYGTDGMPKIVVVGGADHKIYYNLNNLSDGPGVEAAIDSALAENPTSVSALYRDELSLNIFPNPAASSDVQINFDLPSKEEVTIRLFDATGKEILTHCAGSLQGEQNLALPTEKLERGVYFLQLNAGKFNTVRKLVI